MFFDVLNVLSSLPRFHIIASGTTIFFVIVLLYLKTLGLFNFKLNGKIIFAPLIVELIFQLASLLDSNWSIIDSLPLQFSYLTSLSILLYNFINKHKIKSWLYFAGVWSTTAAFVNTILMENETWYMLMRYYGHHGLLLFYGLESIISGFRPSLNNYFNTIKITSYVIISVSILNLLIDSNYMFTRTRPDGMNFSILMPEWPGYFLIILTIGLTFYSILYFLSNRLLKSEL
tara:strand:+ start:75 stop:767 length:693 start_codon:yes stop_codon:yes gene_type:complete